MTNQSVLYQPLQPQEVMSQAQLKKLLCDFKGKWGDKFHLTVLSYARNEAHPDSDIDSVFGTTNPDLLMTSVLKQDLEAWLNQSVDVVCLHPYLHPPFKARLEHKSIYV